MKNRALLWLGTAVLLLGCASTGNGGDASGIDDDYGAPGNSRNPLPGGGIGTPGGGEGGGGGQGAQGGGGSGGGMGGEGGGMGGEGGGMGGEGGGMGGEGGGMGGEGGGGMGGGPGACEYPNCGGCTDTCESCLCIYQGNGEACGSVCG
jgi:hypothetical protein